MLPSMPRSALASTSIGLAALLACGGSDPVAVSVEMTLDPGSCSAVADPAALTLTCESTAGLWLRAPSGQILERGCADFPSGSTLAALPERLADIDLSTTAAEGISVEVALYGLWLASSGCPAPDELDELETPLPDVIVSGSSGPVDLSESSTRIEVELGCGAIAPGSNAACEQMCADQEADCFDDSEAFACTNELRACEDACDPADDACDDACADGYLDCLRETPEGTCALDYEVCVEDCSPDDEDCPAECDDLYFHCIEVTCEGQADECEEGCSSDGSACASVAL